MLEMLLSKKPYSPRRKQPQTPSPPPPKKPFFCKTNKHKKGKKNQIAPGEPKSSKLTAYTLVRLSAKNK